MNTAASTSAVVTAVPPASSAIRSLYHKARSKLFARTEKRLAKILELAGQKPSITNDDVQKLLRVSHATAFRYLRKLVKAGKLTTTKTTKQSATYQIVR